MRSLSNRITFIAFLALAWSACSPGSSDHGVATSEVVFPPPSPPQLPPPPPPPGPDGFDLRTWGEAVAVERTSR